MPKRIDELKVKTKEAFQQVRAELDHAAEKMDARLERMREKLERRREPRVQLKVGGAR